MRMQKRCIQVHSRLEGKLNYLSFPGRIAFEKLTDFDYRGNTYYTVKNLSLYECQGWCREEPDCQAAAFSFVLNPLIPKQETLCQLQNETSANNPTATPQRSVNMYYMTKMQLRSENVCIRPWAFERVPNKMIRGLDNALIYTSTKEACLAACLNEVSCLLRESVNGSEVWASLKLWGKSFTCLIRPELIPESGINSRPCIALPSCKFSDAEEMFHFVLLHAERLGVHF